MATSWRLLLNRTLPATRHPHAHHSLPSPSRLSRLSSPRRHPATLHASRLAPSLATSPSLLSSAPRVSPLPARRASSRHTLSRAASVRAAADAGSDGVGPATAEAPSPPAAAPAAAVDPAVAGSSLRRRFLEFYAARGHAVLPSASLVPADPTVLLTIAGMLPFKPVFLGQVGSPRSPIAPSPPPMPPSPHPCPHPPTHAPIPPPMPPSPHPCPHPPTHAPIPPPMPPSPHPCPHPPTHAPIRPPMPPSPHPCPHPPTHAPIPPPMPPSAHPCPLPPTHGPIPPPMPPSPHPWPHPPTHAPVPPPLAPSPHPCPHPPTHASIPSHAPLFFHPMLSLLLSCSHRPFPTPQSYKSHFHLCGAEQCAPSMPSSAPLLCRAVRPFYAEQCRSACVGDNEPAPRCVRSNDVENVGRTPRHHTTRLAICPSTIPPTFHQVPPSVPRATTSQRCVRTNDVENVGRTARHHTFFEMLGNFSFGDYFKQDACQWAWQLATQEFGIPEERIWVSVFRDDDETYAIWKDQVGVSPERIQRLDEEDNFWASGPTGPCGPCSELYYDFHPERGIEGADMGDDWRLIEFDNLVCIESNRSTPAPAQPPPALMCCDLGDDSRFIEFYNLVFMESNRRDDGGLEALRCKNIDTGLGLERLAQILQQVPSNYETDLIFPIVQRAAQLAGVDYHSADEDTKRMLKVIGDHARAVVHLVADGVSPSNLGRGYVVRRLVRRLVRTARLLGINSGSGATTTHTDTANGNGSAAGGGDSAFLPIIAQQVGMKPPPCSICFAAAACLTLPASNPPFMYLCPFYVPIHPVLHLAVSTPPSQPLHLLSLPPPPPVRGRQGAATSSSANAPVLPPLRAPRRLPYPPPPPSPPPGDSDEQGHQQQRGGARRASGGGVPGGAWNAGGAVIAISADINSNVAERAEGVVEEPRAALPVIAMSADINSNVEERAERVVEELRREEERFVATLERGEKMLDLLLSQALAHAADAAAAGGEGGEGAGVAAGAVLSGRDAFVLYDTYGFPVEITEEVARERGVAVDMAGFEREMAAQRKQSQAAHSAIKLAVGGAAADLAGQVPETEFVGYSCLASSSPVLALVVEGKVVERAAAGQAVDVVLARTPFYAEGGGQIADWGHMRVLQGGGGEGGAVVRVRDVQRAGGGLWLHRGEVEEGEVCVGDEVEAVVDEEQRLRAQAHHTATHLLQAALREQLGPDVAQAGSLVAFDRLRFDFHFPRAVMPAELTAVEARVNKWIAAGAAVTAAVMPIADAKAAGAIAMFGEKYGDEVRVIDVPGISMELCGGTHVGNTAHIRAFKLLSEAGIAAGVRRIEAVAGEAAVDLLHQWDGVVKALSSSLKVHSPPPSRCALLLPQGVSMQALRLLTAYPHVCSAPVVALLHYLVKAEEVPARVAALQEELRAARSEAESLRGDLAVARSQLLLGQAETVGAMGCRVLVAELPGVTADALKTAAESLAAQLSGGSSESAVVLASGSSEEGKVAIVALLSPAVVKAGVNAGKLAGAMARVCGGGGGGRPNFAQAGGRQPEKLPEALAVGRAELMKQLGA
ncbi:unnamed protein product [Closterium sp. NIES-65]|nr:unnamed protein product [Closterium sp. NIES-65]